VVVADNQMPVGRALAGGEAFPDVVSFLERRSAAAVAEAVGRLLQAGVASRRSAAGQRLVDGLGTQRVVEFLDHLVDGADSATC
jgi:hypothetical protein